MSVIQGSQSVKTAQGEYDFAVDGGAVSTITLRSPDGESVGNVIPNGSIILGGYIEVDTALTSGGSATVAIDSEGSGDLQTAAAIGGAPWSSTGIKSVVPDFAGANAIKTTSEVNIAATIATAALTAGKFRVVVFYK